MGFASDSGSVRVLVVDDNPVIRDSVNAAVQRLNERLGGSPEVILFEAEDGATAWDLIQEQPMHLLVVDLYIPVLDGIALIKRVRGHEQLASIPILAVSASIQDARTRSIGAGADFFLQKPVRLAELMEALARLLRLELP